MKKDDIVYLRHILECIRRIAEDVAEGRERFMESHTLQDAVLRNLQVMAELTQRLSETAKATQPEVEWWKIAAFGTFWSMIILGSMWTQFGILPKGRCLN
jgi:uncharacterized protein with HEPN domain